MLAKIQIHNVLEILVSEIQHATCLATLSDAFHD